MKGWNIIYNVKWPATPIFEHISVLNMEITSINERKRKNVRKRWEETYTSPWKEEY